MTDPNIPSAQIHPRGAAGHAKRAGAKLKNAALTALALLLVLSVWGGIAYIKQRLGGGVRRQPTASERADYERRAESIEREEREQRCPGMSASACEQMQQMQPYLHDLEAKAARYSKPGLSGPAALGPDGSKYLRPDQKTITQKLWGRAPAHVDIIDAIRKGRDQTATIRIKVGTLIRFADELDVPSIRPALAFDDGGPPLSADDEVIATLKATRALDELGDLEGPAPIVILEASRPPEQRVSAGIDSPSTADPR